MVGGQGGRQGSKGSWNNEARGTSWPGARSPAWVYARLGIRFTNNDINSAGRATDSGRELNQSRRLFLHFKIKIIAFKC